MRALQEADVIVADRLVSTEILERARRDAQRILVGKTPGRPSPSQAEINAILLREARAGKPCGPAQGRRSVRIRPWRRGAGCAASRAGIPVEVVPGISAAMGCAAAIGLALTEREERRSLTLLTGHASDGPAEHDWAALARPGQTAGDLHGRGRRGSHPGSAAGSRNRSHNAGDRGRERHAALAEDRTGQHRSSGRSASSTPRSKVRP